jgi:16S rRNA (guanine1207-N2)-methyltransferase
VSDDPAGRPGDTAGPTPAVQPAPHYFSTPAGPVTPRSIIVRLVGEVFTVQTADHVFSGDRVDLGTRVLLREVPPPPPTGVLLDLGCGWGPIALSQALLAPRAAVWAVDVNDLALELTTSNARKLSLGGVRAVRPEEVPAELRFDAIWSNPPIRIGKQALHDMLLAWLPRLSPAGTAYLVVQRNLGADSLHSWLAAELPGRTGEQWQVDRFGSAKGYRVLRVTRSPQGPRPDAGPPAGASTPPASPA